MKISAVVLAAGKGKRMNSTCPKVMLPIHGKPIIHYVLDTLLKMRIDAINLILGYKHSLIEESLQDYVFHIALQDKQLGTGHAVQQCTDLLEQQVPDYVLIMSGDVPFVCHRTLKCMLDQHLNQSADISLLTAKLEDPSAYGRIIKKDNGRVCAIREFKDCSSSEVEIQEINAGTYIFNRSTLLNGLQQLTCNNAQHEFYLTDLIGWAVTKNKKVISHAVQNHYEILGANTPDDLRMLEQFSTKN